MFNSADSIDIHNNGLYDATGVLITHPKLPLVLTPWVKADALCKEIGVNFECFIDKLAAGQTLSLPFSLLPSQVTQLKLSAQLQYFADQSPVNNSDEKSVEIVLGTPNLVIKSPLEGEFLARSTTDVFMNFDLPGILTSLTGEHLRWYLDGDSTGVDHTTPGVYSVNLGPLSDGWHSVTLKIVNQSGTVVRENLIRTVRFEVGTPQVRIVAPGGNKPLRAIPGADLRVAFVIDGWPLTEGRTLSWALDGVIQAKNITTPHALRLPNTLRGKLPVTIHLNDAQNKVIYSASRDIIVE